MKKGDTFVNFNAKLTERINRIEIRRLLICNNKDISEPKFEITVFHKRQKRRKSI